MVILVGGGIGVILFVFILKDIVYKFKIADFRFLCKKVYGNFINLKLFNKIIFFILFVYFLNLKEW